jgi:hypothetical protein
VMMRLARPECVDFKLDRSRSYCLKYLPLLGQPQDSVVMLDDVSSPFFGQYSRNGVSCEWFECDAENDDYLLRVMPLLRAVASADSVRTELDHWRPDGYSITDDFGAVLRPANDRTGIYDSDALRMLGRVDLANGRRAVPVPAFAPVEGNDEAMMKIEKLVSERFGFPPIAAAADNKTPSPPAEG